MVELISKAKHINPLTGFEVPDETHLFFDVDKVEEDQENYYLVKAWEQGTRVYSKAKWKRG
jgi:hypothetical protein